MAYDKRITDIAKVAAIAAGKNARVAPQLLSADITFALADAVADGRLILGDDEVHRCIKDRTAAIRWANQSVEMLQDAFFPLADALRALERYLRDTPHHNALEAAAARKALAVFDNATAQGTSASGQDPQGLGAKPAGPVHEVDAPND